MTTLRKRNAWARSILVTTVLSLVLLSVLAPRAAAHKAECPFCKLGLVQNTDSLDYEVAVKYGNKRIEYRCIYCVFGDQKRYIGDIVVYAPSEKKGEPVVLKRTEGVWSAPEGTVFLNSFKRHKSCAEESRTFTSQAAFDAFVKAGNLQDVKALTLAQMLEVTKKAK